MNILPPVYTITYNYHLLLSTVTISYYYPLPSPSLLLPTTTIYNHVHHQPAAYTDSTPK